MDYVDRECEICEGTGEIWQEPTMVSWGETMVYYGSGYRVCDCVLENQALDRDYQAWLETLTETELAWLGELN